MREGGLLSPQVCISVDIPPQKLCVTGLLSVILNRILLVSAPVQRGSQTQSDGLRVLNLQLNLSTDGTRGMASFEMN